MLSDITYRLRSLFRRREMEGELDDEMHFHFDNQVEAYCAEGVPLAEAKRRARLEFGIDKVKEECREARGVRLLEETARDLRFAAQNLMKNPGFTAVAALSLALGVGANAAVFAIADAFLFRTSPLARGGRVVSFGMRAGRVSGIPISYPNFLDWQRENQVFERMAAYRIKSPVLSDESGAERVPAMQVTSDLFAILGAKPVKGRDFNMDEHRPGGAAVAILSYELWQRRYSGSSSILGKPLALSDVGPVTVIGVMPAGFRVGPRADVYASMEQVGEREPRDNADSLYGAGLLKPGVTIEQARAQMASVVKAVAERNPKDSHRAWEIEILPFGQLRRASLRPKAFILMGAAAFVLLIACVNLSNLLLARASGRVREMAIRRSLGASRVRLVRQLLVETLLLATIGGVAGLLCGYWGFQALLRTIGDLDRLPGGAPLGGVHFDARVLAVMLAVAVAAGLASGIAPALRASRRDLSEEMRQAGSVGAGRGNDRRWRNALVASEVALAFILLTGGILMIQSLYGLITTDTGFNPRGVLTLSIEPNARGGAKLDRNDQSELGRRLVQAIEGIPGVVAASPMFPSPFWHGQSWDAVTPDAQRADGQTANARVRRVGPHYGRALDLRLRLGTWFTSSESESAAVINEEAAREYWPGQNPVKRRFSLGGRQAGQETDGGTWFTVAGVCADALEAGFSVSPSPEIYVPEWFSNDFAIRVAGDPMAFVAAVRGRIRAVDPGLAVHDAAPMTERISNSLQDRRTLARILSVLAAVALALAAVGIYGVIAHATSRRIQEVGLRMALGARPGSIAGLILRQGMVAVAAGILIGAAGGYAITRLLSSQLFHVKAGDPAAFAGIALLMTMVGLFACWFPVRRAMRVDPAITLRYQ